jgi:DNA-directed RNA polymerase specialized sigma24 family protein
LSRFNNLSHNEISARLSISPKTIETHISKALKYLRKTISLFF